jgi:hypothetical protein
MLGGLKLIDASGRSRLICQPSSRTGQNPPYGMIGRIEETSASFEARSAPRSHPTEAEVEWRDAKHMFNESLAGDCNLQ